MHPEPDSLAARALGEPDEGDVSAHLLTCATCTTEVADLRRVRSVARAGAPALAAVPPSIWAGITATLDESEGPQVGSAPARATEGERFPTPGPAVTDFEAAQAARVAQAAVAPAHARRRRIPLSWVAGGVAAGLIVGVGMGRLTARSEPDAVVLASASLQTLDTGRDLGSVDVRRSADGLTDLIIHTDPEESIRSGSGYLEVWLINRDDERMVSVGVLRPDQADQSFAISPSMLSQGYVVVDISQEQYDDAPEHSGDSLVRGTLPA